MLVLLLTHVTTGKSAASVKIEEAESAKLLKNKQSLWADIRVFLKILGLNSQVYCSLRTVLSLRLDQPFIRSANRLFDPFKFSWCLLSVFLLVLVNLYA